MTVPNQGESLQELLREVVQQLGRMADGYERIATELHRANLVQLQGFVLERLDRAIDDPVLAESLSVYPGLSDEKRRQMLNANAQYGLILLAHRVGSFDRTELLGHLKALRGSQVFAEYWARTAEARGALPWESFEARVGRAVDAIMDERLEDLEEWWVVDSGAASGISRRLGDPPGQRGSATGATCPDLFELDDGNFAVIGTDATEALDPHLPTDAARADHERIVVITRETLIRAKRDIPDA